MRGYRYLEGLITLRLDNHRCVGCGACVEVCPHRIFSLAAGLAILDDPDLCMECGACARNCPVEAITVSPGVGCAVAILTGWLQQLSGRRFSSGCC